MRSVTWPGPASEPKSAGASSEAARSDCEQGPCLGTNKQTKCTHTHLSVYRYTENHYVGLRRLMITYYNELITIVTQVMLIKSNFIHKNLSDM